MYERKKGNTYKKGRKNKHASPDAEFLTDRDGEGLDDPLNYEPLRSITGKQ